MQKVDRVVTDSDIRTLFRARFEFMLENIPGFEQVCIVNTRSIDHIFLCVGLF